MDCRVKPGNDEKNNEKNGRAAGVACDMSHGFSRSQNVLG